MAKELRLLFIHGWATDSSVWVHQRGFKERFETLFLNLPGHGGGERWNKPNFSPAIKQIKEILKDGKETIPIGWSLGGEILFALPFKEFKNIKGIVTIGSSPSFLKRDGFPFGQSEIIVRGMKQKLKKDFSGTLSGFYSLNFSAKEKEREEFKDYLNLLEGTKARLIKEDCLLSLDAIIREDNRNNLPALDCPVLLIYGESDNVCPFGVVEYLSRNLPNPKVEIFKEAGHMPFLTEPYGFNKILEGFIKRVVSGQ